MPQKHMECFRLLLDYLAWIKDQFLSGIRYSRKARETVRDDERCGRSKEVNTPELIGQIKNFMDKDCCVSISAQFDVSMGSVHTIICEELNMRKFCAKFVPRVFRENQKERHCHDSREMVKLINSDPTVLDALVTCNESWIYCYDPESKRQSSSGSMLALPDPIRPDRVNPPTNFWWSLLLTALAWSTFTGFPLDSQQGILCWGFKGVQEEIPSEEASTLQIGSVAFPAGQCTSPQLHPCHRLFDQDGLQDSSSASHSPDLAPCDFCLFPKLKEKLRGCRYETIEEMKEACDEGHWHVHTRGLPWGLPEVVGMVKQVHCSQRRLLWRGLELHVSTINKSAHTKKVRKLIVCSL